MQGLGLVGNVLLRWKINNSFFENAVTQMYRSCAPEACVLLHSDKGRGHLYTGYALCMSFKVRTVPPIVIAHLFCTHVFILARADFIFFKLSTVPTKSKVFLPRLMIMQEM